MDDTELVLYLDEVLIELNKLQTEWLETLQNIHDISAALVDASVNLEQRLDILKDETIALHEKLKLTWETFKQLMQPLWKANQDLLPVYVALDNLYTYLVDLAKHQTKMETQEGIEMMRTMQKRLKELTHKSGKSRDSGQLYQESIQTGNAIIKELESEACLITLNIQSTRKIDDKFTANFKNKVEAISKTLMDISRDRHHVAYKWVTSAISDIEIIKTKIEANLDLLVNDK